MSASPVPDLADVLTARQRIAPYLQPTPLYRYPALDAVTGAHAWVKHENHQPVGAFKVRGGVNLVSQLTADDKRRGEVIGVQSGAAPAAYRSWRAGSLLEDTTSTFAEGLATRTAFELPQRILRELLDDFVLVSDEALKAATRLMIEKTRNLVEPAGAAALAAVLDAPGRFADREVALICSGGNISPAQLVELWPRGTT